MQKKITEAHLILIVTFGLYMGYQSCVRWLPFDNPAVLLMLGQLILVLPGLCRMLYRYRREELKRRFMLYPLSGKSVKMAVCVLLCAYPVVVMLNFLSMLFVKNAMAPMMFSLQSLGIVPMLFIMAVMPAVNEEFICRGILYQVYRPVSVLGGAVLSALIFGLLHLNFNQMPYAFFVGIVFALMAEATGSIYTSVLMHFLLNGFNVALNFISNILEPMAEEEAAAASQQFIQELTASPEVFWYSVKAALAVIVFFMLLTGLVIRKTFKINNRTLRRRQNPEMDSAEGKGRILDIWIFAFIIFALILTYLNTNFL